MERVYKELIKLNISEKREIETTITISDSLSYTLKKTKHMNGGNHYSIYFNHNNTAIDLPYISYTHIKVRDLLLIYDLLYELEFFIRDLIVMHDFLNALDTSKIKDLRRIHRVQLSTYTLNFSHERIYISRPFSSFRIFSNEYEDTGGVLQAYEGIKKTLKEVVASIDLQSGEIPFMTKISQLLQESEEEITQ